MLRPLVRSSLLDPRPASWRMGDILPLGGGGSAPFFLHEEILKYHMAVFGGSGFGKSKFLELLCRHLIDTYRGFCLIDPHSDLCEDLLAYACKRAEATGSDAICKRILYLEPTFETVFGYDPFEYRPDPSIAEGDRENAYHAWLKTKADVIAEIVQRKQGASDFQGMPRLQRILTDVLVAVGTAVDASGKHLPLSDALVLLDRMHPRHEDVMRRVYPRLPDEVRGDFDSLASYKNEAQRKTETESTINRLRSLLSPIVKAIFDCSAEKLNFRKVIQEGCIVLVSLRKTEYFSADQRNAIGGMIVHEILDAAEKCPREKRRQYYLLVDEARLFAGEDLMESLDQHRKFGLSVILAGQYPSQFKTEKFDLLSSILENGGTTITFRQKSPDSLKLWKEFFGYPNLDFTQHEQVMDRPDGSEKEIVEDWSYSSGTNAGASVTDAVNGSQTKSAGSSYQVSRSESDSEGQQSTSQCSSGRQTSSASGMSESLVPYHATRHASASRGDTESFGYSDGRSESHTESISRSKGMNTGIAVSDGWSLSLGRSLGVTSGDTVSYKTVFHPKFREEWHRTGRLAVSVDDQFHKVAAILRCMPPRYALITRWDDATTRVMKVGDVPSMFTSKEEMAAALKQMKQKIYALHPYYARPDLRPEAADERLRAFLEDAAPGAGAEFRSRIVEPEGDDDGGFGA